MDDALLIHADAELAAATSQPAAKQGRGYFWLLLASVVVLSFAYGLKEGLSPQAATAFQFHPTRDNSIYTPSGVVLRPAGDEVRIDGRPARVFSFLTNKDLTELVENQLRAWRLRGLVTMGGASGKRGFGVAFDRESGDRFAITAHAVPEQLRATLSEGYAVQGSISQISNRFAVQDEAEKIVPNVPMPPGGKAGSMFSALDAGGRSYTASYVSPLPIDDVVAFYRAELPSRGWSEAETHLQGLQESQAFASLGFVNGRQELTLLFTDNEERTSVATVILTGGE